MQQSREQNPWTRARLLCQGQPSRSCLLCVACAQQAPRRWGLHARETPAGRDGVDRYVTVASLPRVLVRGAAARALRGAGASHARTHARARSSLTSPPPAPAAQRARLARRGRAEDAAGAPLGPLSAASRRRARILDRADRVPGGGRVNSCRACRSILMTTFVAAAATPVRPRCAAPRPLPTPRGAALVGRARGGAGVARCTAVAAGCEASAQRLCFSMGRAPEEGGSSSEEEGQASGEVRGYASGQRRRLRGAAAAAVAAAARGADGPLSSARASCAPSSLAPPLAGAGGPQTSGSSGETDHEARLAEQAASRRAADGTPAAQAVQSKVLASVLLPREDAHSSRHARSKPSHNALPCLTPARGSCCLGLARRWCPLARTTRATKMVMAAPRPTRMPTRPSRPSCRPRQVSTGDTGTAPTGWRSRGSRCGGRAGRARGQGGELLPRRAVCQRTRHHLLCGHLSRGRCALPRRER